MFAHFEGVVAEKGADYVVIDVGGVGYLLNISGSTFAQLPEIGGRCKLYSVLNVREDAMELFGFYTREEKHMYERLKAVNGIGSRTALQILSSMSVRDLSVALVTGDSKSLERVPGIGKKTAQRLLLELKDKIEDSELIGSAAAVAPVKQAGGIESEAIEALQALGYAPSEAARAVAAAAGQTDDVNQLIFLALRGLG